MLMECLFPHGRAMDSLAVGTPDRAAGWRAESLNQIHAPPKDSSYTSMPYQRAGNSPNFATLCRVRASLVSTFCPGSPVLLLPYKFRAH